MLLWLALGNFSQAFQRAWSLLSCSWILGNWQEKPLVEHELAQHWPPVFLASHCHGHWTLPITCLLFSLNTHGCYHFHLLCSPSVLPYTILIKLHLHGSQISGEQIEQDNSEVNRLDIVEQRVLWVSGEHRTPAGGAWLCSTLHPADHQLTRLYSMLIKFLHIWNKLKVQQITWISKLHRHKNKSSLSKFHFNSNLLHELTINLSELKAFFRGLSFMKTYTQACMMRKSDGRTVFSPDLKSKEQQVSPHT